MIGPAGPIGAQGLTGASGKFLFQNFNVILFCSNWKFFFPKTGKDGARGEDGEVGLPGVAGAPGPRGLPGNFELNNILNFRFSF